MSSIKFGTYTPPEKTDLMSENEILRAFKEHQYYNSCYVTNIKLHDGDCAVTVIAWYDLKRYYHYPGPKDNKIIYRDVDIVAVGIDGNGTPRVGWHEKKLFKEILVDNTKDEKISTIHKILDAALDTKQYHKLVSTPMFSRSEVATSKGEPIRASKQKANHKYLKDTLFNKKKLLFGTNKEINLSDEFVAAVKEISKFTRENDTTYPYSVINEDIQEFDTIRTAIGLVSSVLPISKAYKMTQGLISYLADAFSGSALVVPASDLYNLRGPVNLSKVTYQLYDSDNSTPDGKQYYEKRGKLETNDDIIIFR